MDLIGKNGKIDGILAAQVLLDGGVFSLSRRTVLRWYVSPSERNAG